MFRKSIFIALFLSSTAMFTGCASTAPPPTEWLTHEAAVKKITTFSVRGKLAFISPEERLSASFYWKQDQNNLTLQLTNFLGATLLKLDASPTHATLIDHNGIKHVGKSAPSLLKKLTGVSLPIHDLMLWIKGLPSVNNPYQLGQDNRLQQLSEFKNNKQGWTVTYQAYDGKTDNLLPAEMMLTFKEQKVKLKFSQWEYTQ